MTLHDSARSHEIQTSEKSDDIELKNEHNQIESSSEDRPLSSTQPPPMNNDDKNNLAMKSSLLPQCVDRKLASTPQKKQEDSTTRTTMHSSTTMHSTTIHSSTTNNHDMDSSIENEEDGGYDQSPSSINVTQKQSSHVAQSSLSSTNNPPEKAPNPAPNKKANREKDSDSDTHSDISHRTIHTSTHNHIDSHNHHKAGDNRDNQKQQTIHQILTYLKDFKVNDDLNEDEIVPTITKMNARSKNRRRHKRWLMRDHSKGDTIRYIETDFEQYWNDDDIFELNNLQQADLNQLYLNSMINVVDDNFFADIIENIENSSTFLLDENVLQNLRRCLAMKGKGIVRKRRDILVVVNENDEVSDESDNDVGGMSSDDDGVKNRRRTRRMIQESKEKHKQDPNGLDDLISSMIEIEEEEGRSININFDDFIHQARKLRVRKKDTPKENSRKRELSSPLSQADNSNDVNPIKKRKKKKTNNISGLSKSPQSPKEKDLLALALARRMEKAAREIDDGSLYAILPEDDGNRRSARRSIEQRILKVNSVIVEGRPFPSKDDNKSQEEAELDVDGNQKKQKRAYKKRGPYGKRGPYKKRKKNGDVSEEIEKPAQIQKEKPVPAPIINTKNIEIELDEESTETTFDPEDSCPVSLNLLDWRRRQKRAEGSNKKADKGMNEAYLSTLNDVYINPGLETSMVSWDTINQNTENDSTTQPPTMEPPRKRASNYVYGRWCSQLLHCLQGRGRLFARHEFFYSDVDKAWYNEDVFGNDLLKIGVPADSRLTRAEWSLVRRKIRRRPRLFSKKFISSQMKQLENYRESVRKIQQGHGAKVLVKKKDFNYEVLAPPKIGTVVTAYSKRAKMIHRGTILAHHRRMHFFLVQFERKELSWDWVRDTDVASHGLPEVLLPKMEVIEVNSGTPSLSNIRNIGSITCGTCFGPLVDFYKREFEVSAKKTKTKQLLSQLKRGSNLDLSSDYDFKAILAVAEREALAKTMNIIDSNLERKRAILDAMNEFHMMGAVDMSKNEVFKNHYTWLHDNLTLTEEALESAFVHQQILYSKIYTGMTMVPNKHDQYNSNSRSSTNGGKKNDLVIQKTAKEIADELVTRIVDISNNNNRNDTHNAREALLTDRLSSATRIMLINALLRKNQPLLKPHVSETITNEISRLSSTKIPHLPSQLTNITLARDAAVNDLKESLKMLESELHHGFKTQRVH